MNFLLLSVHPLLGMCALALLFLVSYLLVLGGRAVYRFFLPRQTRAPLNARASPPRRNRSGKRRRKRRNAPTPPGKRPSAGALPSRKLVIDPKEVSEFYWKK